ncbi:glycerophosphodiester phosphodiesterase GDPDL1-like [Silene latifolia]|uniref:glycerophosphodiester phosphodiesterase GDPDL1-like n=1 Tax=Silene latifolia TaxID=37657 RepID=UPI003D78A256
MKSLAIVNVLVVLLLVLVVQLPTSSSAHNSKWRTLDGSAPLVIARGGLSGMFPYASEEAYQLALNLSVTDVIMWCDIQLTKDDYGLCLPNLVLNKGLNVDVVYPNRANVYFVNGVRTEGYFPIDFSLEELLHANLTQEIYSRPHYYNDVYNVETVENVFKLLIDQKAVGLWLNIQNII